MSWLLRIVGALTAPSFDGTLVPVEEPSTASIPAAQAMRTRGAPLWLLLPAIKRCPRHPDGPRRRFGGEAVGHCPAPPSHGVASSRRFDTWGLRGEKTRRRPAASDNVTRQEKNLHRGSPSV